MCPLSPLFVPLDIDSHNDEELLLFLVRREPEDPIPTNVITGVDPFSINPSDSSENDWYMYKLEEQTSSKGEDYAKVTRYGYWKQADEHKILERNAIIGRKITLEFYEGKAPNGKKTRWLMWQYLAEEETVNGVAKTKEFNSLCRLSFQMDRDTNHENPNYSDMSSGQIEQFLLNILEPEESNSLSQDAVHGAKTVPDNEKGQSAKYRENPEKSLYENPAEDMNRFYDFLKEDYLELNDLSQGTSSASSENSSRMSLNSEEDYFDADALKREIEADLVKKTEEEHADSKFSTSETVKSSWVVVRPPSLGTVQRHGNVAVEGNRPVISKVGNMISSPGTSSAKNVLFQNRKSSNNGRSGSNRTIQVARGSHDRSNSKGNGLRSVSEIAKLGRKYCCLGSFCSYVPHLGDSKSPR